MQEMRAVKNRYCKTMGNEDGASSPLPHPCHAISPDVMGTDNSWGWCARAACERLLHLQKPNPSVKPAKD